MSLFRGRPDEIEQLLKSEPQLRQFLDFQAIEKAKRAPKPKVKGEGSGDFISAMLGEDEEGLTESEGEENPSESESESESGDLFKELGLADKEE